MTWQGESLPSLCSGVKEYGTKHLVLGIFKGSAIFLDVIRRSFVTKLATAGVFTSVRVDFGRPLLSSLSTCFLPAQNREYHLKTIDRFTACSHKPFAPILVFLSQTDRLWNKILWQLSVHIRHP